MVGAERRTAPYETLRLLDFAARCTRNDEQEQCYGIAAPHQSVYGRRSHGYDANNRRRRKPVKSAARDTDILRTVRPADLATYLCAHNWRLDEHYEDRESFWSYEPDLQSGYELLLPLKTEFRDYALRVSEALETLEIVERRSRNDILKDIVTAIFDVVRVRVDSPRFHDGSIGLDDSVALFENARKMVTSAARSAYQPRAQFITGMPDQVADYVRKVRVGQTERGSYVVNILSPLFQLWSKINCFPQNHMSKMTHSSDRSCEP